MLTESERIICDVKWAIAASEESSISLDDRAEDKSLESEMGAHLFVVAFFTSRYTFCFSESGLDPIIVSVASPWRERNALWSTVHLLSNRHCLYTRIVETDYSLVLGKQDVGSDFWGLSTYFFFIVIIFFFAYVSNCSKVCNDFIW